MAVYICIRVLEASGKGRQHNFLMLALDNARGGREYAKSGFALASIRSLAGVEQSAEQVIPAFACSLLAGATAGHGANIVASSSTDVTRLFT